MDPVALRHATEQFVTVHAIPLENEFDGNIDAAGGDDVRRQYQAIAKAAGVFAPHAPIEFGGLELSLTELVAPCEAAGYSVFGPLLLGVSAPDDGNVHLLDRLATDVQRERYLAPLARGDVRSAFAKTEPAPGAGSDSSALPTSAERVAGGWVISGEKQFITGADGAGFFIIMARTAGKPGDLNGVTMFLAPAEREGLRIERRIDTIDQASIGGHCEVTFDRVFVPDGDVLGEVDGGFANAQIRLGPARVTHVMRWLGAARRAHDAALSYVAKQRLFGTRLGELGTTQAAIADSEIDLAATRALLLQACAALDAGQRANTATSIAKTFAAEALGRVVDRAMHMCGEVGVTTELPIARVAREIRPFRVSDGANDAHRYSIARRAVGRVLAAEAERRNIGSV